MIVGQGPIALAVGAGGGCLDIFSLINIFPFPSPSLWETARYRLKYCLKGPLTPKQPTNQLNDDAMLYKIQGFGGECIDMVAYDLRYYKSCMNSYLNKRPSSKSDSSSIPKAPYDQAFEKLISEIYRGFFEDGHIYFVTTLRNRYINHLKELGIENVETYRNKNLVERSNSYYNKEGDSYIRIIPQVGSSSIVCSAKLNVGNLFKAISDLKSQLDDSDMQDDYIEEEENVDRSQKANVTCFNTAKLLRSELKDLARLEG